MTEIDDSKHKQLNSGDSDNTEVDFNYGPERIDVEQKKYNKVLLRFILSCFCFIFLVILIVLSSQSIRKNTGKTAEYNVANKSLYSKNNKVTSNIISSIKPSTYIFNYGNSTIKAITDITFTDATSQLNIIEFTNETNFTHKNVKMIETTIEDLSQMTTKISYAYDSNFSTDKLEKNENTDGLSSVENSGYEFFERETTIENNDTSTLTYNSTLMFQNQ